MVRRRIAFVVGVVVLILIILLIGGCLKSRSQQALESYNQHVSQIVGESNDQVSHGLFSTLATAPGSTPQQVEQRVNEYRQLAQSQAAAAKVLSVPSSMRAAQQDLLIVLDLREEGLNKITGLVRQALSGQSSTAISEIAGDMEIFLASDVLYSQRVVPLIQQTLQANGISSQSTPASRFLPNIGWLQAETVQQRLTGQASATGSVPPGNYGHHLVGAKVAGTALIAEPELNRIKAGATPTLTAQVENSGEHIENGVKVNVTVTTEGVPHTYPHIINRTEPGKTVEVAIPLEGVKLGKPSKVAVSIEKVPGEDELANNKATYLVVFEA